MNKNHFFKKILTFFVSVSLLVTTLSSAALQLGNMSYGHAPAPTLLKVVTRGSGFFQAVGGVAFEAVAIPHKGIVVNDITYNGNLNDGNRLKILLTKNGKDIEVSTDIYDWALVPIANFSDSKYGSAMTLFGKLDDVNESQEILEKGGRVINYHQDFKNTLVGLRLFQADILIFQENSTDLFKENGKYILGNGEIAPNVLKNRKAFKSMSQWLTEQRKNGMTYRSYVVGDLDQKVTFNVKNKKIVFQGKPYWTMWKNEEQYDIDIRILEAFRVEKKLSLKEKSKLSSEEKLELLMSQYLISQNITSNEDLEKLSKRLDSYTMEVPIQTLQEFSDLTSKKVYELNGINPAIYDTVEKVMHYSALFRHFKETHPKKFKIFLQSLKNVKVLPKVETPTIQYKPLRSKR